MDGEMAYYTLSEEGPANVYYTAIDNVGKLPVYFGILKIGALAVPLNFRYTPLEIKNCLNDQLVEALVGDADQSLVGLGLAAGIGLHLRPGPGDDVEDGRLAAER